MLRRMHARKDMEPYPTGASDIIGRGMAATPVRSRAPPSDRRRR